MSNTQPTQFDGFSFHYDPMTKEVVFAYFDDVVKKYGPEPKPIDLPEGRERYHALLTTLREGVPHMDPPFVSTFTDVFTYADNLARTGFSGVMVKDSKWAQTIMDTTIMTLLELYGKTVGFVFHAPTGDVVFDVNAKANTKGQTI